MQNICEHIAQISTEPEPNTPEGCEECLKSGDVWVHLRVCLVCGHVGCCDKSKNKHARKHYHRSNHAVIKSLEPGENWKWCYIDKIFVE